MPIQANSPPRTAPKLPLTSTIPTYRPQVKARVRRALDAKGPTQPKAQTSPSPETAVTPQPSASASPSPSVTSPSPSGDFGPLVQFDKPPSDPFEKWLEQRAKEKMGEHGSKMALFIATLFSNLPYMMLCCIPLFAFVLKVLYVRKRVFYIDHLVYALHIHSFAYLAIMLIVLITLGLNRRSPALLRLDHRGALDHLRCTNLPLHPPRLSTGLVFHHLQVLLSAVLFT